MDKLWKKIKAFTLAEMLVVLTVAIIIMAASAPMITKKAKKPPGTPGGGVGVPVGAIMIWGGEGPVPFGWVECDGRPIKDKKYAKLRAALGVDYVPDMSGTYLMGVTDQPPADNVKNQAHLKEMLKNNPEAQELFMMMTQGQKPTDKGYPKPILVRWIVKAEL